MPTEKPSWSWKRPLLIYAIFAGFFLFATLFSAHNDKYEVQHTAAISPAKFTDGSYTPGSPEAYTIQVSPKKNWHLIGAFSGVRLWRLIGYILLALGGVYLYLISNDYISLPGSMSPNIGLTIIAIAAAASLFASSSSSYVSNQVTVTPERYEQIKDNPDSLGALFDSLKAKNLYIR